MPLNSFRSGRLGFVRRFRHDQRGGVAITFALSSVVLLGATGLAVDSARWYSDQSQLARVADAASLAGASALGNALAKGQSGEAVTLAQTVAANYVMAKLGNDATASITAKEFPAGVAVTLQKVGSRTLSAIVLGQDVVIGASAETKVAVTPGMTAEACIVALDPNALIGIDFSLGGEVVAHNCAIWSNSKSSTSIDANGSGRVEATVTCAVGGIVKTSLVIEPAAIPNCPPAVDPLANWNPPAPPACTVTGYTKLEGMESLSPGVFCGGIKIHGATKLVLQPGIYHIVGGGLKVNGGAEIVGSGVTFVMSGSDATVDLLGSIDATLSAPTSGPTAGLVFASGRDQPTVNSKIGGGAKVSIAGTVYLPTHNLGYGGNSETSLSPSHAVLIGKTIKFHGGAQVEMRSDSLNAAGIPTFPAPVSISTTVTATLTK